MKKLTSFLVMSLLFLASCSQAIDELAGSSQGQQSAQQPTRTVTLNLSRSSEDVNPVDIKEISIYVYQIERKKDSLVYAKTMQVGDGNLNVELPLGENLQTFVVANAPSVTDTDSLATVKINLGQNCAEEVYISDIVSFKSDYTTSNVDITLHRLVGQAVFSPKESLEDIAAFGKFDKVDVTFTNVATSYKVQSKEVEVSDVTLSANQDNGYKVSAYSFPTTEAGTSTGITYKMYQGANLVNETAALIDAAVVFEPSKRYVIEVPLTDEGYVKTPWDEASAQTRAAKAKKTPISVTVTDF